MAQRLDASAPPQPPSERDDSCDTTALTPTTNISGLFNKGWNSTNTALGDPWFDPSANTSFQPRLIVPYLEALALYGQGGIARKIVDLPVDDATRPGYRIDVEDNPLQGPDVVDYLASLPVFMSRINKHKGSLLALNRGEKYARAFRGAIVLMGLADGSESPSEPLDESRLSSIEFLRVLSKQQVTPGQIVRDPSDPWFGMVSEWRVNTQGFGNMMTSWHSSRLLVMPGFPMPEDSYLPGQDSYWPVSIYDIAYKELLGAGTTEGTADALIQKSSLLAWIIPNLQIAIEGGQQASLMSRMRLANHYLSSMRLLVLGRGEDVKEVGYKWTGLAEMLQRNKPRLAAAVDIPVSRLFGESMSGLAGDGLFGDRVNYAQGNVEGHVQETKLRPPLERLIDLAMIASDGPTNGNASPYRMIWGEVLPATQLEQSELRLKDAQTNSIYLDQGVLTAPEVRLSLYGGLDYNSQVTLLEEEVPAPEPEVEPEVEPAPDIEPEIEPEDIDA